MKIPDLKIKRPQLSRKRSSGSKLDLKPPKFAADLYADLRDRRLLPLVALLLIAIVATPILLAGEADDEATMPTPPVASSSGAAASRASFTVVPAETKLRDYHRRLGHREARNPFRQPVPPAPSTPTPDEGAGGGSESEETSGEPSVPAAPETPAETSPGPEQTTTDVVVQNKVIGYEIDAKAGFIGHVNERDGIAPTTKLPSPKNPVIVFMGLSKDKKRGLFLMSSNVTAYYGKARCALDKQACQLVELKPGKSATFAYGYGEARYKLTLKKIVPVVDLRKVKTTVTSGRSAVADGGVDAGK